jgi:hypothetical protein
LRSACFFLENRVRVQFLRAQFSRGLRRICNPAPAFGIAPASWRVWRLPE